MEFQRFGKIPRLSRDIVITEKLDGTNAQILIISKSDLVLYGAENNDPDYKREQSFVSDYSLFEKDGFYMFAGSRKRWLDTSSKGDNFGFAKWVQANAEELLKLGEGRHYGEWYGKGIQRGYGLEEKRFALFNVGKWHKSEKRLISINPKTKEEKYTKQCPECCGVVPIVAEGMFTTDLVEQSLQCMKDNGSFAVLGFMKPEGVVIYHTASGKLFKKTIIGDEKPKGIV